MGAAYFLIISQIITQKVSATGRSLVQRSPTECGVSVCDLETSTSWPKPEWGCCATRKKSNKRINGPEPLRCIDR
jgi:hypothetical protein